MAEWSIRPCDGVTVKPCTCSDGKFTITPESQDSDFVITYTNGSVKKEISYHKDKECVRCTCNDIKFTYNPDNPDRQFGTGSHDNVLFGTISYLNGSKCDGLINVYGSTGINNLRIEGNKVIGNIEGFSQKDEVIARVLKIWFGVKGVSCPERYEFYQQAFRGTDNGVDTFANAPEKVYPTFLLGYSGSESEENAYCRTYGMTGPCTYILNGSYASHDSITVDGGAWIYYNNEYIQLIRSEIPTNGMTFGDNEWLNINLHPDNDGMCKQGFIVYSATTEWDGGLGNQRVNISVGEAIERNIVRRVRFKLASNPTEGPKRILTDSVCTCNGIPCNPDHAGEECAKIWYCEIIQLPKGHHICFDENGDYKTYRIIPVTEPCTKSKEKGGCECKSQN